MAVLDINSPCHLFSTSFHLYALNNVEAGFLQYPEPCNAISELIEAVVIEHKTLNKNVA